MLAINHERGLVNLLLVVADDFPVSTEVAVPVNTTGEGALFKRIREYL